MDRPDSPILTFALWDVLDSVRSLPESTPADIAHHTGRTRGQVIRLLLRALELGWVTRSETWTTERRRSHRYTIAASLPAYWSPDGR